MSFTYLQTDWLAGCSKVSCSGEEACSSRQGGRRSDDGKLNYFLMFIIFCLSWTYDMWMWQ